MKSVMLNEVKHLSKSYVNAAREGPYRRVDCIIGRSGEAVAGIQAPAGRHIEDIVAKEIEPQTAHVELLRDFPWQGVTYLRTLEIEIARLCQEPVRLGRNVLVQILEAWH